MAEIIIVDEACCSSGVIRDGWNYMLKLHIVHKVRWLNCSLVSASSFLIIEEIFNNPLFAK